MAETHHFRTGNGLAVESVPTCEVTLTRNRSEQRLELDTSDPSDPLGEISFVSASPGSIQKSAL